MEVFKKIIGGYHSLRSSTPVRQAYVNFKSYTYLHMFNKMSLVVYKIEFI